MAELHIDINDLASNINGVAKVYFRVDAMNHHPSVPRDSEGGNPVRIPRKFLVGSQI